MSGTFFSAHVGGREVGRADTPIAAQAIAAYFAAPMPGDHWVAHGSHRWVLTGSDGQPVVTWDRGTAQEVVVAEREAARTAGSAS